MNLKCFPHNSTLTTPQKGNKGKNRQMIQFWSHFHNKRPYFFLLCSYNNIFYEFDTYSPHLHIYLPQKGASIKKIPVPSPKMASQRYDLFFSPVFLLVGWSMWRWRIMSHIYKIYFSLSFHRKNQVYNPKNGFTMIWSAYFSICWVVNVEVGDLCIIFTRYIVV